MASWLDLNPMDGGSLEEFTRMLHVRAQIFLAARASQQASSSTNTPEQMQGRRS
jgi:hypothetical protein